MPLALADLEDRHFTLALGGGGALGFAHVGVLLALEERGLRPAAVAGTSMGAVVGATFALRGVAADCGALRRADMRAFAMAVLTRGASYRGLLRRHFLTSPAANTETPTLPSPFEKGEGQNAGDRVAHSSDTPNGEGERDALVGDCAVPFIACAAVAGRQREPVWLDGAGLELWRVCAASSALPMVFAPVEVGGVWYRDGGTADNLPCAGLRRFGLPVVAVELGFLHVGRKGGYWEERLAGMFGVVPRHDDLGGLLLQPDVARFSPQSFGRFDDLVAAGRECVENVLP